MTTSKDFVLAFSVLTFLCLSRQEAEDLSLLAFYFWCFCDYFVLKMQNSPIVFTLRGQGPLITCIFTCFVIIIVLYSCESIKMKRLRHFYTLWKYSPKGPENSLTSLFNNLQLSCLVPTTHNYDKKLNIRKKLW